MHRTVIVGIAAFVPASFAVLAVTARASEEPVQDGKPLSVWIKQLSSAEKEDRRRAAEALGKLTRKARSALPALFDAVQEKEGGELNEAAAEAVLRAGAAAVPVLIQALWEKDRRRCCIAAFLLGRMGGSARPAIPSLIEQIKNEDDRIRWHAIRALGALQARQAVPVLLPLLDANDAQARQHALAALMDLGIEGETIVPHLIRWLQNKDKDRRLLASRTLYDLGGEAAPAVTALIRALRDEDRVVRAAAVLVLGRIGPAAKDAVLPLTAALKDESWIWARDTVAEALWRIARHAQAAPALKSWLQAKDLQRRQVARTALLLWQIDQSPEAITALGAALGSKSAEERRSAIEALIRIGSRAKAALPAAVGLLKENDPLLRVSALLFLGRLGEHARWNRRYVSKALEDENAYVRLNAAFALWQIDKDPKVLRRLARALEDKDVEVRRTAAERLGMIPTDRREAMPALLKALHDPDSRVRLRSAAAVGPASRAEREVPLDKRHLPEALAVMVQALSDEDAAVRAEAATGLGILLRGEGRPVVGDLAKRLWDDDAFVRSCAAEGLGRIGSPAAAAVPALTALLHGEEEDHVQSAAAEALGQIGPAAKPAVPVLREKLKHPDCYVRVCAALALWNIAGDRAGLPAVTAALAHRNPRVRVIAAEMVGHAKRDPRAVAVLLKVLREGCIADQAVAGNMRYMAVRSLGRLGASAKAAVPDLRERMSDEESDVRAAAVEALRRIDPKSAATGEE